MNAEDSWNSGLFELQLGPAAPLQLVEEASDWLLFPGPVPGGGGGERGAACLLATWYCGTVMSRELGLCSYRARVGCSSE